MEQYQTEDAMKEEHQQSIPPSDTDEGAAQGSGNNNQ
jgi:hypothetical protein